MSTKQRLELEIVDIDEDLKFLAKIYPNVAPVVDRVRDALGRCIHLVNGVNTLEFCSNDNSDGAKIK